MGRLKTIDCPACGFGVGEHASICEAVQKDSGDIENPLSNLPPTAARAGSLVMAFGAEKYEDHESYLKDGRPARNHVEAAYRHLHRWEEGELQDHESGEHPLAHAAARILMALELKLRKEPG